MFLLLTVIGVIVYLIPLNKYAGILWPKSSIIEKGQDAGVTITLKEEFKTNQGSWPIGTVFEIYEDKIHQIETYQDFEFYGFKFKKGGLIVSQQQVEEVIYQLFLKTKMHIDGLDLHEECILEFKKRVLFAASCPEFEKVFFKRFISPESLNLQLEGEQVPVD